MTSAVNDGPRSPWYTEAGRHLRARLDALYFHLYGPSRDDAGYVLETFPIVRREDEKAFGHCRTQALILAYMKALGRPKRPVRRSTLESFMDMDTGSAFVWYGGMHEARGGMGLLLLFLALQFPNGHP